MVLDGKSGCFTNPPDGSDAGIALSHQTLMSIALSEQPHQTHVQQWDFFLPADSTKRTVESFSVFEWALQRTYVSPYFC
jgi:hypothetical protein